MNVYWPLFCVVFIKKIRKVKYIVMHNIKEYNTQDFICNDIKDMIKSIIQANLENCINDAQDTSKEDNDMAYQKQRVIIGKNEDGSPKYKYIYGATQDERDIEVVKAFIESGRINEYLDIPSVTRQIVPEKTKLKEYAWQWYKTYKRPHISSKYKGTIEGRLRRLCRYFKNKYIEDIVSADVQIYFDSLAQTLTTDTVRYYRNLISQILDSAIEDGIITKNVTKSKRIMISGLDSEGRKALSVSDCKQLISYIESTDNNNEALALSLMLYTGLRREEMLGLRWEDVDFSNKMINIKRAIVFVNNGRAEIKQPKTKKSARQVPMADALINVLKPRRQFAGFVVSGKDGELFYDYEYKKFWDEVRRKTGFPTLDARQLRHTYATLNVASGVDLKTVSVNMGHTKIATTADIYTQVEPAHAMAMRNQLSHFVQNQMAEKL